MITLIGHGYIGRAIAKRLVETNTPFAWYAHTEFNKFVAPFGDVIINAAGYTGKPNVDSCEIHKADTISGNIVWPLYLEELAGNTPVIHISSGCVYTGYKDGGWLETDEPNFNFDNGSFYSGSKTMAQKLLQPYLTKSYLFRIRMPFGDEVHPSNLLTKLSKYQKLINFRNSLTNIVDCANAAIHFAKELPEPGIYNVCNPGSLETKDIADTLRLTKEWFTAEEFTRNVTAPRSNCVLNVDKLMSVYPINEVCTSLDKTVTNYLRGLA